MKTVNKLFLFLMFLFAFSGSKSFAQANENQADDNNICLEFIGSFDGTVLDLTGLYTAQLIQDNKIIKEVNVSVLRPFKFLLKRNSFYTVRLIKPSYITKAISISTLLPKKLELESTYKFNLETNLVSAELQGQFKDDDVDFPVALVSYGKKCNCFEYNRNYTENLITSMNNKLVFGY